MRLSILVTAISLSLVGLSVADNVQAAMKKHTNIPAQGLGPALQAFAKDRNLQIVYVSEEVNDLRTRGVAGDVTADEALAQLLQGTDLGYRYLDEKTVTVFPAGQGDSNVEGRESQGAEQKRSFWQRLRFAQLSQEGPQDSAVGAAEPAPSGGDSQKRVELEEIVVTGTHLHNAEPITPVITITNEDMIKQGYTRLDQALEQLPQNFKGAVAQDTNGITATGTGASSNYSFSSGVNLRGLGPNATLVLLNGRRLSPTAFGQSVDISQIPVSVIARVEILTDGASATYGSDAIGGVVNIITRKDFSGVETGVRLTGISHGKDPNYGAFLTGGADWGSGNLITSVDYERDNPLYARNRSFTAGLSDPTSLFPEQETTSGYVSLRHSFTDRLSLSSDALVSRREYSASDAQFGPISNLYGQADQVHGAVQLDYAVTSGWTLSTIAQFGRERDTNHNTQPVNRSDFTYETPGFEARADGAIAQLPGGDIKVAFGVLDRRETFKATFVNARSGNADDRRTARSAYGEILIPLVGPGNELPLVKELRVDVAGRYDDYSDFGSASTPKFALQWVLSGQLSLHGSYAKSFKAPTLYSLNATSFYAAYVTPVLDPSSPTGTSTALLLDGNNPNLKPERAESLSIGFRLTPTFAPGLTADLSYFSIDYDEKIVRLGNEGFFTNVVQDASLLGSLVDLSPSLTDIDQILGSSGRQIFNFLGRPFSPTEIVAIANIGNVNIGSSRVRGLDGTIRYERATSWGRTFVEGSASYLDRYDNQILPTTPEFSIVDSIYSPLRLRAKLNLGFERNSWSANARVNYANSYQNDNDPSCPLPGCSVASWTTFDISASYISASAPGSFLDGLRLSFDVANVFDRDPPFVFEGRGLNYDPTNANPLGRAFSISFSKRWGDGSR